jgi:hypothetical protein
MYIPMQSAYLACLGDLENSAHFDRVYADLCESGLIGSHLPEDECRQTLSSFLRGLPPVENQRMIRERLIEIAEEHGAALTELRWWDIVSHKERWLNGVLLREGHYVPIALYWRTTKKGSTPHLIGSRRCSWARDVAGPTGWRYEIDCETYQEMKAVLCEWLSRPLVLPESWRDA